MVEFLDPITTKVETALDSSPSNNNNNNGNGDGNGDGTAKYMIVGQPPSYKVIRDDDNGTYASEESAQEDANKLNAAYLEKPASGSPNAPVEGKTSDELQLEAVQALFPFFPKSVQSEFAESWVKYGDQEIALTATRNSNAWKEEFGYLKRDDGSLIMSEIEAMSTKATYKESLAEVGIADFSDFEDKFNELIKGEVSAIEFQDRIDRVYAAVKNNIPQVEQLFRERYNIPIDAPTIFGALINPDIQDKVLAGDIKTLGIAGEAGKAGFTRTFTQFETLRKAGITQQQARQLYGQAEDVLGMGVQTGRDIDISTIEEAAMGSAQAEQEIQLLAAESRGMSSAKVGAAKKDRKVTGLIES
jgi:hypothetical protein